MSLRHAVIALVVAVALPRAPAAAQTLSLGEALRRAETGAYANRVAEAQARAQEAQASLALRGVRYRLAMYSEIVAYIVLDNVRNRASARHREQALQMRRQFSEEKV